MNKSFRFIIIIWIISIILIPSTCITGPIMTSQQWSSDLSAPRFSTACLTAIATLLKKQYPHASCSIAWWPGGLDNRKYCSKKLYLCGKDIDKCHMAWIQTTPLLDSNPNRYMIPIYTGTWNQYIPIATTSLSFRPFFAKLQSCQYSC